MTNIHTADFNGKTYTRTSESRTYTFCVAVVRTAWTDSNGYAWPAWEGVETWSSTKALAEKAAAGLRNQRHYTGTERYSASGRRQRVRVQGNGPATYSSVQVLPVTLTTKAPKVHATDADAAKADLAKRKARATRRAANNGTTAIHCIREAVRCHAIAVEGTAPNTDHAKFAIYADRNEASAVDYARTAWHLANERLALDIPARDAEGAIVAPTVLDVPALAQDVDGTPITGTCWYCKGPAPAGKPCPACADPTLSPADFGRGPAPAIEGVVIDATGPNSYTVIAEGVEMKGLSPDAAREIYNAHRGMGGDIIVMKEGPL